VAGSLTLTITLTRPPDRRAKLKRRGVVYGFKVTHPVTGEVCWGYVGQTRQQIWEREDQHREDKPWSDTIVGDYFQDPITGRIYQAVVLAEGEWDDAELDARELSYIRSLLPLYNIVGNMANPCRVKPWDAKKQRHLRDRAAGRPLWHPTPKRVPAQRPEVVGYTPRRHPVPFRVNWGLVLVAQLWIVFTGGMVWATSGRWLLSLGVSTAVVVGLWLGRLLLRALRQLRRWLRPRHRRYRHR
jgi:hypothetical protein